MTEKSLGQVFHDAFVARLNARETATYGRTIVYGSFSGTSEEYRADAEAAAQAVAYVAWADGYGCGYGDCAGGASDVNERDNPYRKDGRD